MKIILGARGSGKTSKLIFESATTKCYIVCKFQDDASRIFEQARLLNCTIPFPITYEEFYTRKYVGKKIPGFLIDDLESFVNYLCVGTHIKSVALTPTEVVKLVVPEELKEQLARYASLVPAEERGKYSEEE